MENKLRFSWLVNTIYKCSGSDKKPSDFLVALIDNMLLDGTNNPLANDSEDYLNRIFRGNRFLSRKKASKIYSRFNMNKLVDYFHALGDNCLYNIESIIKEEIPDFELDDTCGYNLANLFLSEIRVISEAPHTVNSKKKYIEENHEVNTNNNTDSSINEVEILKAREFLLRHKNEKSLMPLCQIAYYYDPDESHVRHMYTEYCLLPYNVRNLILERCDASNLTEIEVFHWASGLTYFLEDLKKYSLSSDRYIFMFRKYFPDCLKYADCDIAIFNEYSFERLYIPKAIAVFLSSKYSSLDTYIEDYLYLKDNNECEKAVEPLDYLVINKELFDCSEKELCFWLCKFIIYTCYNLDHRIVGESIYQDFYDNDAETLEDLFFSALYALHQHHIYHTNL